MAREIEQRHVARLDAIKKSCNFRLVSVREMFTPESTSKPSLDSEAAMVRASAAAFCSTGTLL
jgi:hypothetical protein